jgi:hypothetical protein
MTFQEWLAIREGLWLNGDKVLEGLSKLPQPKPKKQSHRKPLTQAVRPAKPQVRPVLQKFSIAPTKNGRPRWSPAFSTCCFFRIRPSPLAAFHVGGDERNRGQRHKHRCRTKRGRRVRERQGVPQTPS